MHAQKMVSYLPALYVRASGAGKTSMFNVLAGRVRSKGRITVDGDLALGGARIDPNRNINIRKQFAFVSQEDALHEASTPRQALRFSARLRLPPSTTEQDIINLVDVYLDELGLSSCADTVIGGSLTKGISGGEKKRVSIGIELISQPEIIFLDEPTSGMYCSL
jgi:ABC-type multidrug transport system ATPase subunit